MAARWNRRISAVLTVAPCLLAAGGTARGQVRPSENAPRAAAVRPVTPGLDRIEVQANPAATGAALELQREIAAQFLRQSFCPNDRMKEYHWVNEKAAGGKAGPLLIGWRGTVQKVTRIPEGWLVRVAVSPCLANGLTAVRGPGDGWYSEEYLYTGERLGFRRAVPPPQPGRPLVLVW